MNRFERRITLRVLAIHVAVVFFLFLQSVLQGCFRPEPKPEIVTFVDFGQPAPTPVIEEVSELPEPEPELPKPAPPPQETVKIPEPQKTPAPIPEPRKNKVEPTKQVEPVKVEPKPRKDTWKPVDSSQIKIGKKINDTPVKPAISQSDIRKELSDIVKPDAPIGNSSNETDAYVSRVGNYFYPYWKPPASASTTTGTCVVRISIQKNGRITGRKKIQGSGDSVYDQTVMDAVNAVSTVPVPPASYPYDYVEVEFRIKN